MVKAILHYALLVILTGAFGFTFATCVHFLGVSSVRERHITRLTEDVLELAKAVRRLKYQNKPAPKSCMSCEHRKYDPDVLRYNCTFPGTLYELPGYGGWVCGETGGAALQTIRRSDCPFWPPEGSGEKE